MSGNIFEWVEDDWHDNYYEAPVNEAAWIDTPRGFTRILRGGSWERHQDCYHVLSRDFNEPEYRYAGVGFRLARSSSFL